MTDRQLFRVGVRLFGLWLVGTGITKFGAGMFGVVMGLASPLGTSAMETFGKTLNRITWVSASDGAVSMMVGVILILAADRITRIVHLRDA
jgi:hypothetical protein